MTNGIRNFTKTKSTKRLSWEEAEAQQSAKRKGEDRKESKRNRRAVVDADIKNSTRRLVIGENN